MFPIICKIGFQKEYHIKIWEIREGDRLNEKKEWPISLLLMELDIIIL